VRHAAPPPTATGSAGTVAPTPPASDFLACMVSDEGGFDDKSFNETSYKGLMDAKRPARHPDEGDSSPSTVGDYAGNVQRWSTPSATSS
jgi:basic membrane protein A